MVQFNGTLVVPTRSHPIPAKGPGTGSAFSAHQNLVTTYLLAGKFDALFADLEAFGADATRLAEARKAFRQGGPTGLACVVLRPYNYQPNGQLIIPNPAALAEYEILCGHKEKALALLERALDEGDPFLTYLYRNPSFDPLRSEPRFRAVSRRLKFTE